MQSVDPEWIYPYRRRFSWLPLHSSLRLLQESRFPVINRYFIAESQFMEGP